MTYEKNSKLSMDKGRTDLNFCFLQETCLWDGKCMLLSENISGMPKKQKMYLLRIRNKIKPLEKYKVEGRVEEGRRRKRVSFLAKTSGLVRDLNHDPAPGLMIFLPLRN